MLFPGCLSNDPKSWSREDVAIFMAYCEKEFDLEKIDMDKFQMNGEFIFASFVVTLCRTV